MVSEKAIDFQTHAREAILNYVLEMDDAEKEKHRDRLEVLYEICRFQPAYKNNPEYKGIRAEMEYTLGITRHKRCTETLARLRGIPYFPDGVEGPRGLLK
jgi:hypothetical protein